MNNSRRNIALLLGLVAFATSLAIARPAPFFPSRQESFETDSMLVARATRFPDTIRQSLSDALTAIHAARTTARRAEASLRARRIANAYAGAWSDSFLIRRVVRFDSQSSAVRRAFLVADSLRQAGIDAMSAQGVPAAMRLWRESLRFSLLTGDEGAVAAALASVGAGHYRLGSFDSAEFYLGQAERLATRSGDHRTLGNVVGVLATVSKDRGDLTAATTLYKKAAVIRSRSGDTRGIAADHNNIGLIDEARGDLNSAAAAFRHALALNRHDRRMSLVALNLGNLAGVAATQGRYDQSESLYRESLSLHRKTGDHAETAFAWHGLGLLHARRGEYREAATALEEALRIHDASGAANDAIAVRLELAEIQLAAGDPETAAMLLRTAGQDAERFNETPKIRAGLALTRGTVALHFGTYAEAEAEYSKAIDSYREGSDSLGVASGLEGKALLSHWRGDYRRALTLIKDAGRLRASMGDRRSAFLTQIVAGDMLSAAGDTLAARRMLESARLGLNTLGDIVGEVAAMASLADLSLTRGALKTAESAYRLGLKRIAARDASELRWHLHTGLAEALRRQGAIAAAASEFRMAIAGAEKSAATLRIEERRSGFLSARWDAYLSLATLEKALGHPAEAFAVSEQMRARQMLDLLARGRVARRSDPSKEEQDLRRRVATLTSRLDVGTSAGRGLREPVLDATAAVTVRRDLDDAQKAYERLMLRVRESDPGYAAMATAKTRSWDEIASRLGTDQVLLEYMLGDSSSTVFVVTSDTVAAIDIRATRQELADLVDFSQRVMDRPDRGGIPQWREPLRRLYTTLILPVSEKGLLHGKRSLLIAPHAELHSLSFASLIAPGSSSHFLIDRFEIAYTPSASVWVELRERGPGSRLPGVVALAPNVARLPASRREVAAIGRIHGASARVKVGAAATPAALGIAIPHVGIVHFATYGVLNRHNPLFSFIELAPSARESGRLEVNQVFGLPLSGQLVILSACQTALASGTRADVPPGDDWVGLVQAFLQAGASRVVATLWPVDDRATAQLMEQFHLRLSRGASPVSALAQAQRALIANPQTSAPRYWAAFTANGQ